MAGKPILAHIVDDLTEAGIDAFVLIVGYHGDEVRDWFARERPELISRVVTLGSPVVGGPKYTLASRHYERHGFDLDEIEADIAARDEVPLKTPVTAIFSKRDGVVSWQACIDRVNASTEHVEVNTTHIGLGMSPDVFAIIADRLGRRR